MIAHADLVAAGVTEGAIRYRIKQKRLIRAWRGVYFVGHADPAHLAREFAALRFAGDGACLSDRPAAHRHGLLPEQVDPTIHISLRHNRASPGGIRFHTRDLHASEVTTIEGDVAITTPARTILDIAPTLDDAQLENVVATALRNRLTTERELRAQLRLRKGARGSRRVRAVLDVGPQWTASHAERSFLRMVRAAELPQPDANARVGRRMPDFLFRGQRVIVEIDSWRWHGDRLAFESDADRGTRWAAQGWTVLRFTPRQLRDHPLLVIARVAAALARAV